MIVFGQYFMRGQQLSRSDKSQTFSADQTAIRAERLRVFTEPISSRTRPSSSDAFKRQSDGVRPARGMGGHLRRQGEMGFGEAVRHGIRRC